MSTLQLSLAIIGGLVLALIVAYNTWTSRRNAPKRALPQDSEHAAEPALRQEPGFDAGAAGAMPPASSTAWTEDRSRRNTPWTRATPCNCPCRRFRPSAALGSTRLST